jgi:outer membrane protein assembly factor BamB
MDGSTLFSFTAVHAKAYFSGSATISNGVLYAGDYQGDLYAFAPSGSLTRKG